MAEQRRAPPRALLSFKRGLSEVLSAIAADRRLAAPFVELRGVLRAGPPPGLRAAGMRRTPAIGEMGGDPPREHDVGFECDADDLLVVGRRHVKSRQLGFGATERCGFFRATAALGGRLWRDDEQASCDQGARQREAGALPVMSDHCVSRPPAAACLRSGQWHLPLRRRSAWSRRGAPCSRAPVRARRCQPICRPWAARRSP